MKLTSPIVLSNKYTIATLGLAPQTHKENPATVFYYLRLRPCSRLIWLKEDCLLTSDKVKIKQNPQQDDFLHQSISQKP
jgi:hypothetical protein